MSCLGLLKLSAAPGLNHCGSGTGGKARGQKEGDLMEFLFGDYVHPTLMLIKWD